jgi:two-component system sensor histidine kinase KdpD
MDSRRAWTGYAWAAGACAACTLAGYAMRTRFDLVNIAMVYLLPVVVVALRFERGPAVFAAAASVLAFDVLFVPPVGTLTVEDVQYLLTFAIMVAVALVISGLVADVRREARIQAALQVEAETERIRGTLLASISHDLRTPLAVITGASSSLAERGEQMAAEERTALARSLYGQARDMSEQVAKLLQMTRLECGAIELQRDWVALPEIAESVLGRLSERLAEHRLMVELAPELPLVRADATLIEQALGNLLENAARHTPAGTLVRLRAERAGEELVVSVEDYGPGLDGRDVERVFDKFSRAGGESASGGVGLGLAICRAIVRLHGGRAWAEQMPGGFTAFRFSLPLEPAPAAPAEPST